ncbi:DUF4845 domain-containing protein [Lampropedia puyangensis]|uniref:DUF4845 domain-containing protein n=1 Tax=Lampropedia puyangensis TaxID=1330072 RepID=A0A4S8FC06_9BURK|nr:DUF4845 domain-containing protein [Lampropedia puyangensis]THU04074.1 DUF4845 domain-containing protein [Lampropedia puyangensis]
MALSVSSRSRIASANSQRGISFIGVCFLAIVVVFAGYVVFKSVPVATEYFAIKRALKQASSGTTVEEVRQAFDRQANIDYLEQYDNPVKAQDLTIRKVNDVVVVDVDYVREVALFGPAFLTYKLSASSQ